jgi:DNA-binding GntR family transcriptional regulator
LVLLALLFIPLGYIVTRISEAKAMDILQIMAVFAVEAVRIFFRN